MSGSRGTTARFELRSAVFRREREASWRELESLLTRIERAGLGSLEHEELAQLPLLYRTAVGSLSVARAISLDRNVLVYLTSLTQRAHLAMYAGRRRPMRGLLEFFARRFPAVVSRARVALGIAILTLALGVLVGYRMTATDSDHYYSFVPGSLAHDRSPSASREMLQRALYTDPEGRKGLDAFAAFLFDHNSRVGLLCMTLGFAAGIPVIGLLFSNGLTLGAMAALYTSRGLGLEFWAWVLPHGVTELLAIALCGAAGLRFGAAVAFPGPAPRLERLSRWGREAGLIVIGAVALFLVAASIEGVFRQLVNDVGARLALAAVSAGGWSVYFLRGARGVTDRTP